ncbi:MAG: RNase adapter RapZ [Erysipelotrichaceae bacterium]|nr:RNase adapter RapZ [Erysipelotrichaceae bacterium]
MSEQNVVLVTGMSGAGKTTAMGVLEDMGYHCIDQFPVQLLSSLEKIINAQPDPRYSNLALATSALDYPKFLHYFQNIECNVHVIFLDASNEKLLLRYKFTRRHHPMIMFSKANTLEEAIEVERDMFDCLNDPSILHIDTTKMSQQQLKSILMEKLHLTSKDVFSISFVSFGYKHGVPMDVDVLFDVRFLPNPFYIAELKELTGNDNEVYDYVIDHSQTQFFLEHLKTFLNYVFEQYKKEKKSHLTVGIGCTGGQHRSVSIINWLYKHYKNQYHCYKSHRDIKVR